MAVDPDADLEARIGRWVATMPVLAGVLRKGRPRCCLHPRDEPDEIRETEWGYLVRHGDHYTLCEEGCP